MNVVRVIDESSEKKTWNKEKDSCVKYLKNSYDIPYEFHIKTSSFLKSHMWEICMQISVAQEHGLSEFVVNYGRVPHKEAIQMQYASDVFLLLTWNTPMNKEIMTGKIYEYMLIQKPIISIICGNLANGEATELTKDLNLGIAVETVDYLNDVERLMQWFLDVLQYKQTNIDIPSVLMLIWVPSMIRIILCLSWKK